MRRRDLLKAAGAGVAVLAAPRIGQAEKTNKLVFVPTENLSVLDPVITGLRSTRNHGYLVFDTLYGIDTSWAAQPQMVEGHLVEEDGLTWNLRLRDGLRFHDNEPVLARDVVASIRRFAARIPFAYALMAATEELSAPDDRTVRFRLKRPFPHLPEALAGPGGNAPVIMPERLAATSPFCRLSAPYRQSPGFHLGAKDCAFRSDRVAAGIGRLFGNGRTAQRRSRLVGATLQRSDRGARSRSRSHGASSVCDGNGLPALQPFASTV